MRRGVRGDRRRPLERGRIRPPSRRRIRPAALRRSRAEPADAAPDVVVQLAVLLQAGVPPLRAWRHLAEVGNTDAVRVLATVDGGTDLAPAIATLGGTWREVAAAWTVAETVGAPLAESLRGIAAALRDAAETADEVRIALAEPAGTAKLIAWLPVVGIVLGLALGFDTFGVLTGSPAGIACFVGGALLILGAHRWSRVLVRRARPAPGVAGLGADLLAIALSGGVSLERADAIVARSGAPPDDGSVRAILTLSRTAGVPAVELLRGAAALARHRARTDGRLRVAKLSSRLLIPLGVCTLPAFLLLGVAPMLLSVLTSTSLSL